MVNRPHSTDSTTDWLKTRLASARSLRPTACAISETVPTPSTCMNPLIRNPALPAAATPATAASPVLATKYRSTSWQIMMVIMPATIGGAMPKMWLTMEPCVRSFIVKIHFSARGCQDNRPSTTRHKSLSRRDELGGLQLEQAAIDAARARRERSVGALLDDLAAVEHQDAVEAAHRRKTMRDHDRGAALHQPRHRLLDQPFRFRIEARGGLVQDQHRRIRQERARQRHALPLASRQFDAALAHQRAVTFRQPLDEVVCVRQPRRLLDRCHAGAGPPIGDVLRERDRKSV